MNWKSSLQTNSNLGFRFQRYPQSNLFQQNLILCHNKSNPKLPKPIHSIKSNNLNKQPNPQIKSQITSELFDQLLNNFQRKYIQLKNKLTQYPQIRRETQKTKKECELREK